MKLAILTHFSSWQDGYALHVGWKERAQLLDYFSVPYDFLVNDSCNEGIFPNQKSVLIKPKNQSALSHKQLTDHYEQLYLDVLKDYDKILTADIIYQKTFLPQNEAIHRVAPVLKAEWFHWIHSSWVQRPPGVKMPQVLRFMLPPKSTAVYMNQVDAQNVASMLECQPEQVKVVYNPKDIRSFFDFHPMAWKITQHLKPWNKDIFVTFPFCSTRMDAKGFDSTVRVLAALKRAGMRVGIVFANANAKKRIAEIGQKKALLLRHGFKEYEDYVWSSTWLDNKPLPRQAVANLFSISNLFVFASWSEVSPNVLLEAKINNNLLVLSNRLACLSEFGGPDAIYFDSTVKTPGIASGDEGDTQQVDYKDEKKYFDDLIKKIIPRIPNKKYQWEWSYERIWNEQFRPLLGIGERIQEEAPDEAVLKVAGILNITGNFQGAISMAEELSKLVDVLVIRHKTDSTDNIAKLAVFEAANNCNVKLIKATKSYATKELVEALVQVQPSHFLLAFEDGSLPPFEQKDIQEFIKSGNRADVNNRMFKYEKGVYYETDAAVELVPDKKEK